MTTAADKFIEFAKSQRMTDQEFSEAIGSIYSAIINTSLQRTNRVVIEQNFKIENASLKIIAIREVF